ncbi:hypothetical protein [Nocardia beijingensis]|nr:hypothetical protein [Nocardia beijingensis]
MNSSAIASERPKAYADRAILALDADDLGYAARSHPVAWAEG